MVENTVDRVLAAEKAAGEIIQNVEIAAEQRKNDAALQRDEDRRRALREAKEQGDEKRAKAREAADAILAEAEIEAEKTARVLSTMALSRGDDVLNVILEEIRA